MKVNINISIFLLFLFAYAWTVPLISMEVDQDPFTRLQATIETDDLSLLLTTINDLHSKGQVRNDVNSIAAIANPDPHTNDNPLLFHIFKKPGQCMNYFLEQHVDLSLRNKFGNTIFYYVSPNVMQILGKNDLVKRYLESANNEGKTALLHACFFGFYSRAYRLVQQYGANVHSISPNGSSCIHYLCNKGYKPPECINLITCLVVDKKVNINGYSEYGDTPLLSCLYLCDEASQNKSPCRISTELCNLLVQYGANIRAQSKHQPFTGETFLEMLYRKYSWSSKLPCCSTAVENLTKVVFYTSLAQQQDVCFLCNKKQEQYKFLCGKCLTVACIDCRRVHFACPCLHYAWNKDTNTHPTLPEIKAVRALFY